MALANASRGAVVFLACLTAATAPDAALAEAFIASTGDEIELAPPEGMSCRALSRKLSEIDATGYRGARPRPRDPRDHELFLYELRVSKRFYASCGNLGLNASQRRCVFVRGFRKKGESAAAAVARCRAADDGS